ncbi:hypothetical protein V6Z11_D06G111000 [Gossypium hirsutum]
MRFLSNPFYRSFQITQCSLLLPVSLCRELDILMCKFRWYNSKTNKRIHWSNWSSMCTPKTQGEIDFRDVSILNKALSAKQGWKLTTNSTSLLTRVMKAK